MTSWCSQAIMFVVVISGSACLSYLLNTELDILLSNDAVLSSLISVYRSRQHETYRDTVLSFFNIFFLCSTDRSVSTLVVL